eukprot:6457805-Amphidinium_carterae.1
MNKQAAMLRVLCTHGAPPSVVQLWGSTLTGPTSAGVGKWPAPDSSAGTGVMHQHAPHTFFFKDRLLA